PVRIRSGWPFAEQQPLLPDAFEEGGVADRVGPVDPAGKDGDGAALRGERAAVSRRVDSERAAGDDRPAPVGQAVTEVAAHVLAVRGAGPGADDGHRALAGL